MPRKFVHFSTIATRDTICTLNQTTRSETIRTDPSMSRPDMSTIRLQLPLPNNPSRPEYNFFDCYVAPFSKKILASPSHTRTAIGTSIPFNSRLKQPATLVTDVRADQVGGGLETLCIKIGYHKPRRAESREGSSTQADSCRVT